MRFYTGIGARDIPESYGRRLADICGLLSENGWGLRSGAADGSDTWAEEGHMRPKYKLNKFKEIYLPYKGFNGHTSELYLDNLKKVRVREAEIIASKMRRTRPVRERETVKQLFTRNVFQVLGQDLKTPSEFVVCYTKDGTDRGGTGANIRLAKAWNIPVFNLYYDNIEAMIKLYL